MQSKHKSNKNNKEIVHGKSILVHLVRDNA
jgi:hypothetical protein